jgi:hypothetical protein
LSAGVPEDRIAQVLREASATRPCEGQVIRKRFVIPPAGQGAGEPVTLLDGLIQVSATGPAGPEDPNKSTQITISQAWAPQPIKLTGLPVQQTIAINNLELKLLVEPSGLRGYGAVSLTVCGKG